MGSSAAFAAVVIFVCACDPSGRTTPPDLGTVEVEDACRLLDIDAAADIPDAGDQDADERSDTGPDPYGGELRAWLLRRVRFVRPTAAEALGFDVDSHRTDEGDGAIGCGYRDLTRHDGTTLGDETGIDSVLGPILDELNALLRLPGWRSDLWLLDEAPVLRVIYREWAIILMIVARPSDTGFEDDASVEAYLFEGRLADGINLMVDEHDLAAPHQTVRLGAGRTIALQASLTAEGRLAAAAPYVEVAYPTAANVPIELQIHALRIHADLALDGAGPGVLGGFVARDSLIEGLRGAVGVYLDPADDGVIEPADEGLVGALLDEDPQRADVELDGASCNGCEAFSVSLDFEAIPVRLEGSP